jgi:bifunctional non-homologous end joining protein LigD
MVAPPELALCTLVTEVPAGAEWIGEVKYDGYRLTVAVEGGVARCFSRKGEDWSERLHTVAATAAALPVDDALLDGEIVVFDEQGVSRFDLLQEALSSHEERIVFVAFDLIHLNGHDLTRIPTLKRKDLLRTVLADQPQGSIVRLAEYVEGDVNALHEVACAQGLEGVVAKRADAAYPAGRTRSWLKIKCRLSQELVIGGYTEPAKDRSGFGALLAGYYDGDRLVYAGRVGSGFSEKLLQQLYKRLSSLERSTSPFDPAPKKLSAPHWVEPQLVAQVAFAEWTSSGVLRQPSFKGLLEDRDPQSVVKETPARREAGEEGGAGSGDCCALASPESAPPSSPDPATVAGIRITNPGKQLFPGSELTKKELAEYYEAVAPWMLPEVAERPLTLVRCPVGDGKGKCFYQRHPDKGLPEPVSAFTHALSGHDEADEWLRILDVAGLISLAQMGVAEIHTWLSRDDAPGRPDRIVLDLDPGPEVSWSQIVDAARLTRAALLDLGLTPFVKSTGSKGLHVVVPVEPVWGFERIRPLARVIAEAVAAKDPTRLTVRMAKRERLGRIFIDYVRNSEAASAVAPYSTRYLQGPTVAVPLAWDELDTEQDPRGDFTPAAVLERLRSGEDPWSALAARTVGARALRAAERDIAG